MENRKAQSALDFIIAFIAVSALTLGIVRVWIWFDANYARRQHVYQESRLIAGKVGYEDQSGQLDQMYNTEKTPLGIRANWTDEANLTFAQRPYEPLDLTDNWVFRGESSETVTGAPPGPTEEDMRRECMEWALANDDGTCGSADDFDTNCAPFAICMCTEKGEEAYEYNVSQIYVGEPLPGEPPTLGREGLDLLHQGADLFGQAMQRSGKAAFTLIAAAYRLGDMGMRLLWQASALYTTGVVSKNCCEDPSDFIDPNETFAFAQEACADDNEKNTLCRSGALKIAFYAADMCFLLCDVGDDSDDPKNVDCRAARDDCLESCGDFLDEDDPNNVENQDRYNRCTALCNSAYGTAKDIEDDTKCDKLEGKSERKQLKRMAKCCVQCSEVGGFYLGAAMSQLRCSPLIFELTTDADDYMLDEPDTEGYDNEDDEEGDWNPGGDPEPPEEDDGDGEDPEGPHRPELEPMQAEGSLNPRQTTTLNSVSDDDLVDNYDSRSKTGRWQTIE